jgi:hypothetical protein
MNKNLLIDTLPDTVMVDGREFFIRSDFRISIIFELLIGDTTLTQQQKLEKTLQLYYEEIPANPDKAIEQVLDFYACGKQRKHSSGTKKKEITSPIYSFEHDDGLIFSAFYDQYGIDLNDIEYLHWWKFRAMFDALKSDNEIVKIMSYRATDLSSIKDKHERNRMARLKAIHALPSNMTVEEKVSAAGAIFGGGLK